MEKAWKNIINWEFVRNIVTKKYSVEFDDTLKEKGLKIFESLYTNDEIYELEADDMESELIEILISYLNEHAPDKVITRKKKDKKMRKSVLMDLNSGFNAMPSMDYINKMIENNPELLELLGNVEEDDDDDEDRASQMYI